MTRETPARIAGVVLVGAGPGDPGLITLRGLAALRAADVVVHDRLVADELLDLAPPGAERVYVGKARGRHAMTQDEINATLIRLAREGRSVVRLKGGDPFVFGRGGEEAEALAGAGIPFEIVPGVSSAIAGPASAGIPVTHRDAAASVAIVTGHAAEGGAGARIDWRALASVDTIVVLMGMERLPTAVAALMDAGRAPSTPCAVVADATLATQRTVTATLETIVASVRAARIRPPAIVIVGDVVAMRDVLGGWDTRPLSGVRALVTRTREQAGELSGVLRELGAHVVDAPAIRVEPPRSWREVDRALLALASGTYSWLVLTSANGVRLTFERLAALSLDARAVVARVAAVGAGTAGALASRGITADLVPEEFTTKAVAAAFPKGEGRVLLLRADQVEPGLDDALQRKGWTPDPVTLYRVLAVRRLPPGTARSIAAGDIDLLTFASGGTVRAFRSLLPGTVPPHVRVACIGPVTARAAREAGLRVDAVAREHTIAGLAAAAVTAMARPRSRKRRA